MFFYLLLLFTVIPAVELALLIKIGTLVGVGNTLLLIIFTGVLGATLARMQGFSVLRNIQESLNNGIMPTEAMLDGVMIFVGGIVLLTPGLITDTFGFLLLIPLTRDLIKYWVRRSIEKMIQEGRIQTLHRPPAKPFDDFEDADFQ